MVSQHGIVKTSSVQRRLQRPDDKGDDVMGYLFTERITGKGRGGVREKSIIPRDAGARWIAPEKARHAVLLLTFPP